MKNSATSVGLRPPSLNPNAGEFVPSWGPKSTVPVTAARASTSPPSITAAAVSPSSSSSGLNSKPDPSYSSHNNINSTPSSSQHERKKYSVKDLLQLRTQFQMTNTLTKLSIPVSDIVARQENHRKGKNPSMPTSSCASSSSTKNRKRNHSIGNPNQTGRTSPPLNPVCINMVIPMTPTECPEKEIQHIQQVTTRLLKKNLSNSDNLSKIVDQLNRIPITCASGLSHFVEIIFNEAILEPSKCELYAEICQALSKKILEIKDGAKTITFRRILLLKCYETLRQETQDLLRCVGFIGELFRRKLLTENILHVCLSTMLDDFGFDEEEEEADHNNRHDETHQHILQAVCTLLFRVGDVLDISSPASKRTMDEYCKVLELQSREKAWPKSLKTLIEQTLTLRLNGWIRKSSP